MTALPAGEPQPVAPLPAGWQALHHAVLTDGTLGVVATDVDLPGEWARIHASDGPAGPPSRIPAMQEAGRARLLSWHGGGWQDGPTIALEFANPLLDRFADGRWLIVGARTQGEPNARVLVPDGTLLARVMLGDGIEHLAIDGADRIWVGWFDEGIFGNSGWQLPGRERPPSGNGVACFASDGRLIDTPSWPEDAGHIADCYALAVAGPGSWAFPYMDFPLVRFVPGEPARWWRSDLAGPKAIAVDAGHALVAGGYLADAAQLVLVALDGAGQGEAARLLASWRLPLRPAPASASEWAPVWQHPELLTGRGDTLHLVNDGVWHRWHVADLLAAVPEVSG